MIIPTISSIANCLMGVLGKIGAAVDDDLMCYLHMRWARHSK